jgi:DNA-binding response OmpR family regulator
MKVLLLDGDLLVSSLIERQLTYQNFEVIHTSDGEKAIELFLDHHFDVIVSDLVLTNRSAFTTLNAIQMINTKNTPLIIISNFNEVKATLQKNSIDYNKFIQKPFSAQQLIQSIHKLTMISI